MKSSQKISPELKCQLCGVNTQIEQEAADILLNMSANSS